MITGSRGTGFLLSGLLHLAVATAFIAQVDHSAEQNNEDGPLPLTLAMFETAASPEPVPEPMPATPAKVEPEKPIIKAQAQRPERKHRPKPPTQNEPVTEPIIHTKAETTNNSKSMPEPEPEPASAASMAPTITQETQQAPAPSLQQESLKQRYLKKLLARIHRKKHYPYRARRRHEEGEVLVSFVIGQAGEISNIRVSRSSGHPILDKAAIKTVTRVGPMSPLPAELGINRWELAVPIAFDLRK